MTQIDNKELSLVKAQASKALSAANELVVNSTESAVQATDVLSKIKKVGKMITERKEAITIPLNDALKSTRDLFKPIEQNHAEAERIIKSKILTYQIEEQRKIDEAKAKLTARVEKGSMKAETAIAKMEKMEEVPNAVQGKVGSVSMRTIKKVRVTPLPQAGLDEALMRAYIAEGFIVWDESAVKQAALKGLAIKGVEVYEEKVLASR